MTAVIVFVVVAAVAAAAVALRPRLGHRFATRLVAAAFLACAIAVAAGGSFGVAAVLVASAVVLLLRA